MGQCQGAPSLTTSSFTPTGKVQIYGMPISGNVIPAVLLARDKKCGDMAFKDMMKGELKSPEMLKVNPWGQMPSMSDGAVNLAESNAILRYIANVYDVSTYGGMDAVERANIDWALDWASTNFGNNYKDLWYPVAGFGAPPADQSKANADAVLNLQKFEGQFLNKGKFVGGASLNIADYKIGTMLWYLNHPAIKSKSGFELPPRSKQYVADFEAALCPESREFLGAGKGFLDTKM